MGIKDQEAETMTGVFVPAGTPKAIVDLLQKEISAIVKSPDIKARLLELGVVPEGDSPAELRGLREGRHRQVEAGHRTGERSEDLWNDARLGEISCASPAAPHRRVAWSRRTRRAQSYPARPIRAGGVGRGRRYE